MIIDIAVMEDYDALIDDFVYYICKHFGIIPRRISIESAELVGNRGMCFDDDVGEFTILVNRTDDVGAIFATVAHEMIHVKQYMTQNLGQILDESTELPYDSRWWEEEAFNGAVPLVEAFANKIKNIG